MFRCALRAATAATLMLAFSSAPAGAQLRAVLVTSGLDRPIGFVAHPTDASVQFILEQGGRVRMLRSGVLLPGLFLDLAGQIASGGEQGLLGIAFSPDYAQSGRMFVNFTDRSGDTVVARFTRMSSDPLRADPSSRFDLVWPDGRRVIEQPFSNHNGGHMAFGPDGYLYIGMGDGGSGSDPLNLAQNPSALLGKMLRIDVNVPNDDPQGYDVPPTNPFVGRPGVLPEIWALGLRNPWRWSFDDPRRGGTGALLTGDVGQGAWEEINHEPAGAGGRNYGWRNREGAHDHVATTPPFSTPLRDPIWEYSHATGRSVTGGYVYRGSNLGSAYGGRYFFADFVSGRIWSVALATSGATGEATAGSLIDHTSELGAAASSPSSFGVDAGGELYIVGYGGELHRIERVGSPPAGHPDPEPGPATGQRLRNGGPTGRAMPRPR